MRAVFNCRRRLESHDRSAFDVKPNEFPNYSIIRAVFGVGRVRAATIGKEKLDFA